MKSQVFTTYELDNIDVAVKELINNINKDFSLLKNTCGMLFCPADMEVESFLTQFKKHFPHDILGCTSIAPFDSNFGLNQIGISLLLLTADDCEFSFVISDEITKTSVKTQIEKTCLSLLEKSPSAPKHIYAVLPYDSDIIADEYINVFNKSLKNIPVFGGVSSALTGDDYKKLVFYNNKVATNKFVLLAISGNIFPVFSVQNVTATSCVERKRKVTKSCNNIIYKIGDKTFLEYLKDIGMPVETLAKLDAATAFMANPILLENVNINGCENFSFVRTLMEIDFEHGSGKATGFIPENATISISSLKRDEITQGAVLGMQSILKQMKTKAPEGYKFSTLLPVSCLCRFWLISPGIETEIAHLKENLSDEMVFAGFYGYGEIAPLCRKTNCTQFSHNESLVLCAF